MDTTLLGVIIGGLIALLPSLVTAVVSLANEHRKQQHEMQMKRIEWECSAKIEAILQYSESIGICMAEKSPDAHRAYMACFERLVLYVSDSTYGAMLKIEDPRFLCPDDCDLRNLSAMLRKEMLAASGQTPADGHQKKRAGKAAQKFHHFLGACRAAFAAHPSYPSDPVKCGADQAEHKSESCE